MRRYVVVLLVLFALAGAGLSNSDDGECSAFHVMLVNDDGVDAPGIAALAAILAEDPSYRVTVVAPTKQQSVKSHAHITRENVPVRDHEPLSGYTTWSVDGTPATVTRIGLSALLVEDPPALVVSGINRGENDGLGAWTSGTVAAAREAVIAGIPGVAFSLQLDWQDPKPDFAAAARWCKPIVDMIREAGLPEDVYLNVNVPMDTTAVRGYRLARMGQRRSAVTRFDLVREDESGTRWYRSRWAPPPGDVAGTDIRLLHDGWVTIAPLGLDHTAYNSLSGLQWLTALESPMDQALEEAADEH